MNEMLPILRAYLDELVVVRANPHATSELSLRDALSKVLAQTAKQLKSNVEFLGEGKKIAQGRPDYILTRHQLPVGYIEAEKADSDLSKLTGHAKAQNEGFIADLDNFLLTNHFDFRLYAAKKMQVQVLLPATSALLNETHAAQWRALFEQMLAGEILPIKNPADLASILARRAQMLRGAVREDLEDKGSYSSSSFHEFKAQLLPNISQDEFADLYAQTLTYGLFASRCLVGEAKDFSIESAAKRLKSIPLLAQLFRDFEFHLSLKLEWVLREIGEVLRKAPIDGIRDYFQKRSGRADPMIDFYEPFLAEYSASDRELRGVYYTPEAVVSYIVRSVGKLLQTQLGRELGLASKDVKILDPATGTGSFLFAVLDQIHAQMEPFGSWETDAPQVLERVFGLELMVAPYAIAHLKLSLQLEAWGTLPEKRLGIYLSNTLDDVRTTVRGNYELGREVEQADNIKAREQVLVVLGNPPYSGHSANLNYKEGDKKNLTMVGKRLETYKTIDGAPLGEKNPKWLNDDYVKFIAFAQNRIAQSGEGIVAFITNHGYLDNPTFRGMRASLLDTFDTIYVFDLHGNAKKKEVAPDGGKDDNVFDIQQGVAILLAIKKRGDKTQRAQVLHADLWGRRTEKYAQLNAQDVTQTAWQVLAPKAPHYLFVPRDEALLPEYETGMKVTEIFPVNVLGFQTHRDPIAIATDKETLERQVSDYLKVEADKSTFQRCDYRPFDFRFVCFDGRVCDRSRPAVTKNFVEPNLSLNACRQTKADEWKHILASKNPTPAVYLEVKDGSSMFPLYIYTDNLFGKEKRANLAPL